MSDWRMLEDISPYSSKEGTLDEWGENATGIGTPGASELFGEMHISTVNPLQLEGLPCEGLYWNETGGEDMAGGEGEIMGLGGEQVGDVGKEGERGEQRAEPVREERREREDEKDGGDVMAEGRVEEEEAKLGKGQVSQTERNRIRKKRYQERQKVQARLCKDRNDDYERLKRRQPVLEKELADAKTRIKELEGCLNAKRRELDFLRGKNSGLLARMNGEAKMKKKEVDHQAVPMFFPRHAPNESQRVPMYFPPIPPMAAPGISDLGPLSPKSGPGPLFAGPTHLGPPSRHCPYPKGRKY